MSEQQLNLDADGRMRRLHLPNRINCISITLAMGITQTNVIFSTLFCFWF